MAGIEKIKEAILEESKKQSELILSKAVLTGEEILKKATKIAEQKVVAINKKSELDIAQKRKITLSMYELEKKKTILKEKQNIIEDIFEKTLIKLTNLDFNEPRAFLMQIITENCSTGEEEIVISDKLRDICDEAFLNSLNKTLISMGKKGNIHIYNDTTNIKDGFILREEGIEINCSFSAMLKQNRDMLEIPVAKLLFEE